MNSLYLVFTTNNVIPECEFLIISTEFVMDQFVVYYVSDFYLCVSGGYHVDVLVLRYL